MTHRVSSGATASAASSTNTPRSHRVTRSSARTGLAQAADLVRVFDPALLGSLSGSGFPLFLGQHVLGCVWLDCTIDKQARCRKLSTTDAAQALQVVRWREDFSTDKLTIERVYLITSLPPGAATGAQLAVWIRGHWKIENLLHHVRDRTFREDDSKVRTADLPSTMAGLRNLAIGIHR